MSFGSPFRLLGLLALPVALALFLLARRSSLRYAIRFTNLDILAAAVRELGGRSWRRHLAPLLLLLALAALAIALARPRLTTTVASQRATVVLVLDVSGSMQSTDVRPTRLVAAERAIRVFLARVPSRLRVGLVVFAGTMEIAAEPTIDRQAVQDALVASSGPGAFATSVGGSAIGDALAVAVRVGRESPGASALRGAAPAAGSDHLVSVLFLSDGQQSGGGLTPLQGASLARKAGIPVYTVALGAPEGADAVSGPGGYSAAPETLSTIASATGGRFLAARSAKALRAAYVRLGSSFGRSRGHREISSDFVLAAAVLLVGAGLASRSWSGPFP